jgi:hypothetical protein
VAKALMGRDLATAPHLRVTFIHYVDRPWGKLPQARRFRM